MKIKKYIISFLTVVILVIIWFVVTNVGNVSYLILPKPQEVWAAFIRLCTSGYGIDKYTLVVHLEASMLRLFVAFVLSIVTAVPLGLLCGCYINLSSVIAPIVNFIRPIPPLAYYTILVLWLGISEGSKITLLFIAGFAPIFIACVAGVKRINKDYMNASYMLGANKRQTFFNVILPASVPDIFTGIRTAIGVEYSTLVAAEMVAAKKGIGWMVLDASNWLKSDVVFVGVIIMGITGIVLDLIIVLLEKRLVHWKDK